MIRKQYTLLVGLFALGAIVVLGYMAWQFGGGTQYRQDAISVVGEFNQAGGLIKNAPVYLSGVEIGVVEDIKVAKPDEVTPTGKVLVRMRVAQQAGLRENDVPEIAQSGVLGDVVINFIRGKEQGDVAKDEYHFEGKDPVDIIKQAEKAISMLTSEETVGVIRSILHNVEVLTGEENQEFISGSVRNIHALTEELHQDLANMREIFTPEFRADIRTIVAQTRTASEELPDIAKEAAVLLRETRTDSTQILRSFARNAQRLDSILDSLDTILATTARGEGTVGSLVKDPRLYESSVALLDATRDAIVAIKYNAPFGIGRRIKAEEEAAAFEAAQGNQIWRK